MRRWIVGFLVLSLMGAVLVAIPEPAEARWKGHGHGYGYGHGQGYYWGGLAVGALTGLIVGSIAASTPVQAAPPVVYQPQPVYVAPQPVYAAPQPVYVAPQSGCTRHYVQGHWAWGGWVAPRWEWTCR